MKLIKDRLKSDENFNEHQKEILRSLAQNNALHKFCQEVADELNLKGITQKAIMDCLNTMGVDNTMFSVKRLFQIIGEAKFGKSETHRFTKFELSEVEKEVSNLIVNVSKGEVSPVFPSYENKSYDNY
jgi:hypothetical protein